MDADVVIDYENEDYVEEVMRQTGGRGVDVVFDTIGRDTLSRSPDALAQLGRIVRLWAEFGTRDGRILEITSLQWYSSKIVILHAIESND